MIFYFIDRDLNVLGTASTDLPNGMHIIDDKETEEVENGSTSSSFTFLYESGTFQQAIKDTAVGNYVLVPIFGSENTSGKACKFYSIVNSIRDVVSKTIEVYAEDAGLQLINTIAEEYYAEEAHSAEWYVNKWISGSGFEIGTNEVSDSNLTLYWEGETTVTNRILSIANYFDAEVSYSFELSDNNPLLINKFYINLLEARGEAKSITLRVGEEIESITIEEDITELATVLKVTGGYPETDDATEEVEPITLKGYSYTDDNYYIDSDGRLCSKSAISKWKSTSSDGIIVRSYSYDTDSQSELLNRALSALKVYEEPYITYKVTLSKYIDNLNVGDYVYLVHAEEDIYLDSRILTKETSYSKQTIKLTLGDFTPLTSTISAQVKQLAEEFQKIQSTRQLYTWYAYADDINGNGISKDPTGKSFLGIAYNMPYGIDNDLNPTNYVWSQFKGDQGIPGVGKDGQTYYLHIAYANSSDGTTNFSTTDATNRNYVGYYTDTQQYDPTIPSVYTWQLTKGEKGDTGPAGKDGTDGINGTNGTDGKDGTSSYVHIKYASVANPTDSQMTETPSDYIGICTNSTLADPTTASSYTWSKWKGTDGTNGIDGGKGADGKTTYVHFAYATSSDGRSGFSTTPFDEAQYVGVRTDYTEADSTTYTDYIWSKFKGEDGTDGIDGVSIGSVTNYYLASASSSGVTTSTSGWTTTIQQMTTTKKYLWNYEIVRDTSGNTLSTTAPCIIGSLGTDGTNGTNGTNGSNGISVTEIVTQYYLSTSNTAQSGGSWSETVPTYVSGYYYWTRDKVTFSNSTTTYTTAVLDNGLNTANSNATTALDTVNNLEIGGRNLLRNTNLLPMSSSGLTYTTWVLGSYGNGTGEVIDLTDDNTVPVEKGYTISNNTTGNKDIQEKVYLTNGETYTMSLYAKTTASRANLQLRIWNATQSIQFHVKRIAISNTDWSKYSNTFTYEGATTDIAIACFGTAGISDSVTMCAFKLEKGNKATDWTPAPEDVDSAITDVSNKIVASVTQQFKLSSSQTDSTSGSYGDWADSYPTYQTGAYVWGRQKVTFKDGTLSYGDPYCIKDVSEIYAKTVAYDSQITQLSDNITAQVTETVSALTDEVDSLSDSINQNGSDISTIQKQLTGLSVGSGSVTAYIQNEIDNLKGDTEQKFAKFSEEGLRVNTDGTDGYSSIIDSDGIRVDDNVTGDTILKVTREATEVNNLTVNGEAYIAAQFIRSYTDTEYDGTTTTGSAFFNAPAK